MSLVLTRAKGRGVVIDGKILVSVVARNGSQVRLAFTDITDGHRSEIKRQEVYEAENNIKLEVGRDVEEADDNRGNR